MNRHLLLEALLGFALVAPVTEFYKVTLRVEDIHEIVTLNS